MSRKSRIGILTGTFDPVHHGHIAFAIAAQKTAVLDKVVFIIEARPRQKQDVSALAHRESMLELYLKKYPSFAVHQINQPTFDVASTLPILQQDFPDSELYLLMGEDVAERLLDWPSAKELTSQLKIIVGMRTKNNICPPFAEMVVATDYKKVSSSTVRAVLKNRQKPEDTDENVAQYAIDHNLYDSSVTSK